MELYTLNLSRDIPLIRTNASSWQSLLTTANGQDDGFEALLAWDHDSLIQTDDNGPHCILDLPEPLQAAANRPMDGQAGLKTDRASDRAEGKAAALSAGRYAFCQARLVDEGSLVEAIEWFARECWWQGVQAEGPLLVRLVREDTKTALQVLRRLSA